MEEQFSLLFDEAIKLELNAAKLYTLFNEAFPEDSDFWWRLTVEEKSHAALLESGKKNFAPLGFFPFDLLSAPLKELMDANRDVEQLVQKYKERFPTREEAFNVALLFEKFAGESHFQHFMEQDSDSKIKDMFKHLNKNDKDHEKRIISYMKQHDIIINS